MMVWIILTDAAFANAFFPQDILAKAVGMFGGVVGQTASGLPQIELDWLPILIRLFATASISGSLIAAVNQFCGCEPASMKSASFAVRTIDRMATTAIPWSFAAGWLVVWFVADLSSSLPALAFLITTTPLWMAMVLAASANNLAGAFGETESEPVTTLQQRSAWPEWTVVVLAMLAWEATSFWMNERLYAGLLVPHGDSAMYEEHLWNVWHGKGFRSYLDQGLFLGEHIQVIHLLLLPLHMLWPSYLMMELIASSSLAICCIPIFSIARRHSGSPRAAMWLALAWLLFFPMHYLDIAIDLKTLRPSCYGLPFLFWGIDFAERRRLFKSSLCLLIALSTQEDFALIVGPIGLALFLTSRGEAAGPAKKQFAVWSLSVLGFSVAYVLAVVLVVIPYFRGGAVVHYSRYFGDLGNSPGDLIRTALRDPLKILSAFASLRTLYYVLVLTIPLGMMSLLRPKILLAGTVTFAMLGLIQLGNESGTVSPDSAGQSLAQLPPVPFHHFHAPLLPVLVWAAAAGLKPVAPTNPRSAKRASLQTAIGEQWQRCFGTSTSRARFAFFCALGTAATGSLMPISAAFWSVDSPFGFAMYSPGDRATEFPKVLAELPTSARVASTDYVHTRLTHFERSYDYSEYVRAVNNYQPGVPADTDYIVIDTSHHYSRIRTIDEVPELKSAPLEWEVLPDSTNGLFIVLRRREAKPPER